MKYTIIQRHGSEYPISTMCDFFGVSRSGYYAFVQKSETPDVDAHLAEAISQCQQQCNFTYGYRRVWIWLQKQGIHKNPKTVLRVMKKYDLLSQVRRKKQWKNMGQQIYKTGTRQTVHLVLDTIKDALKKEKVAAELQLHSDQGFQYASKAYNKLTQRYGITPSMSRRGNCYDNAVAENFFSIRKTECIYRSKPSTFKEAEKMIDDFIYFYNHERIQLKTGEAPLSLRFSC